MTRSPECGILNRGPWMAEEDLLLKKYIESNGIQRWSTLPQKAGPDSKRRYHFWIPLIFCFLGLMRSGKSCRLRWMNHLRPNVKRGHISPDEEDLIIRLHNLLGNRWSLIAGRVPGRTDNDVKNYWNTHLSKKLACKSFSRGKAVNPIVESQPLICGDHHKDSTALTVELNQVYPEFESAYSDMKYNGVELQDSIISDDDYKFHRAEDEFFSGTGGIAPWVIEFDMEEDIFLPMARFEQSNCTTDLFSDSFISSWTYSDSLY